VNFASHIDLHLELDAARRTGEAVLGLMMGPERPGPALTALKAEHFHPPLHARLFEAIAGRLREDRPRDPLVLADAFLHDEDLRGADVRAWLTGLRDAAPAPELAGELAAQLVAGWGKRLVASAPMEHGEVDRRLALAAADLRRTAAADKGGFMPCRFADIAAPERPWLIKYVLPETGVAFIAGPSKAGKSFLALDMALAVAAGRPWLDRRTMGGAVAYVCAEDAPGVALRIAAWKIDRGGGARDLPFTQYRRSPDLMDEGQVMALADELKEAAAQEGPPLSLVVIDTLAAASPGAEENGSRDMGRIMGNLGRLGRETGALVLAVAHTGKNPGAGIRGWSGQGCGADATLMVERDRDAGTRTLIIDKVKNKEDGQRIGYVLRKVELGVDADGDPVDSCVVDYCAAAEPVRKLSANGQKFLDLFRDVRAAGPTVSAEHLPEAPEGVRAVSLETLRRAAMQAALFAPRPAADASPEDRNRCRNTRNAAFNKGLTAVVEHGVLAVNRKEGLVWDPAEDEGEALLL
jgi:hypothetical protein